MTEDLSRICILSGPSVEVDLSRARTGIDFQKFLYFKVPFRILGAGPDLYKAIELSKLLENGEVGREEYFLRTRGLDHHLELYRFLKEKIDEKVEAVTTSVTLVQNVLRGFENEHEGRYAIVTEPWHYGKFERIENSLKRKGKIHRNLEFFNVPSPDTGYYSLLERVASRIKTELELIKV